MQKLKEMKIKKRLNTGFKMVTGIATIAAVLGIIAMLVASSRYEYAMTNYGFSQGDIGKAMVTFSETRSALRAVVGYDEEDMIEAQITLHDQKKEAFETYLKEIENSMVFSQAKEAYNILVADLDGYWDIDAKVLEYATSSSDDGYLKAEELDTNELSPQYDKIYQDMVTLMDLNVQKGDTSKASLHNMDLIFMIVIIAVIVVSIVISTRIGNTMAEDIEKPLTALAARLKSFAEGDLDSPFPESEADDEIKEIVLKNGDVLKTKTIILATGAVHQTLGVEGEEKLKGMGVSYCATCDGYFYRKKDVLVVGGGNTALEDAIYLSNICNKVYLVHRRDEFRGNSRLVTNIKKCKNISIITDSIITSLNGEEKLSSATIKNNKTNEEKNIDIDGLFVAIGHIPETDFCKDIIELTKDSFVASNELCHTNVDGIFVAGDVRDKKLRQLVTAASDGAVAGNEAVEYLNNEI